MRLVSAWVLVCITMELSIGHKLGQLFQMVWLMQNNCNQEAKAKLVNVVVTTDSVAATTTTTRIVTGETATAAPATTK